MREDKGASQAMLNVVGFMLIVVGLGLDGPMSFVLIGFAIAIFLVNLLVAAARPADRETDKP